MGWSFLEEEKQENKENIPNKEEELLRTSKTSQRLANELSRLELSIQ